MSAEYQTTDLKHEMTTLLEAIMYYQPVFISDIVKDFIELCVSCVGAMLLAGCSVAVCPFDWFITNVGGWISIAVMLSSAGCIVLCPSSSPGDGILMVIVEIVHSFEDCEWASKDGLEIFSVAFLKLMVVLISNGKLCAKI